MARFSNLALRSLSRQNLSSPPPSISSSTRSYIAEMRRSTFKENLLRILRTEIAYATDYRPPRPPPPSFAAFSVEDRPGEQWIRLCRAHGVENVKVDATMIDGAAPSKKSPAAGDDSDARLHISLIVEISKGESCDFVLQFVCSAWNDCLDIEKVFPVPRGLKPLQPFMGPDFRELDDELQSAVREYLEERGVNDDLAEFLHEYMENKDKGELVRWLRNVESYVKK